MAVKLDPDAEVFVPGQPWGVVEHPVVTLVKDVLYMLSTNPAAFFELMSTVTEAMNDTVQKDSQLEAVAEAIFEQSILEPNFTYTGARMCDYLIKNLKLPKGVVPFSFIMNRKTKDVFEKREMLLQSPDTARRLHGTAFFLAELFLIIRITIDGKLSKVLAYRQALQEILESLLKSPTKDNMRCALKLLKMIGGKVDEFDAEWEETGLPSRTDGLFERIRQIVAENLVDPDVNYMGMHILELRTSNWGKVSSSPSPPTTGRDPVVTAGGDAPPGAYSDTPVFYDVEGKVISPEEANLDKELVQQQVEEDFQDFIAEEEENTGLETDFSDLVIPGDEDYLQDEGAASHHHLDNFENFDSENFDSETNAAFEQFLHESQQKRTFGYSSRNWSNAS